MKILSPHALGGTPTAIHLYVENVDAFCARAVAAGATLTRPVADQFYGDRSGQLTDPFGHRWSIATHVADVSNDEVQRRYDAMLKGERP
jgi:PhnB protein